MSATKAFPTISGDVNASIDVTPLPSAAEASVVHIIDDDAEFLAALELQLQSFGLKVNAYHSAEEFLVRYKPASAECIVLDLRMPGMTGIELQSILRQRHCCPPVVVLSAYTRTSDIVCAVKNGAIDYLVKPVDEQVLIERVYAALDRDHKNKHRCGQVSKLLARLSEREREVMDLFVDAQTTIAIAHLLRISPKTVERHRAKIYEKMDVDSVPALIRLVLGADGEV